MLPDTVARAKTCTICERQKDAEAFLPSRYSKDGLTDICRSCVFDRARSDRMERESKRGAARYVRKRHRRHPSMLGDA